MTAEQRVVIGGEDIEGFEFECPRCSSRFLIPITKFDSLADKCPNCREKWFEAIGDQEYRFIHDLLNTLKIFADPVSEPPVKIRFQLKEFPFGRETKAR